MKSNVLIALIVTIIGSLNSQTLTLVTNKRLYEHHSSTLSGQPYGNANVNTQSGYDFVTHSYVPAAITTSASNRDMVEHNGYYGINGNSYGLKFGFTSNISNIGGFNYAGNNTTTFHLNNSVSFATLNTVQDLVAAFNSTAATKFDTAVVAGNIYIVQVRNTNTYLAMRIVNVSNLTPAQVTALDNNQSVQADVNFDFEYKYGTVCTPPTVLISSSQATLCAGQTASLTASGASSYSWTHGGSAATATVKTANTTTYVVSGSNGSCTATTSFVQAVKVCTDLKENLPGSDVSVYPNPTTGNIKVNVSTGQALTISNSLGEQIYTAKAKQTGLETVDMTSHPAGIYIITISDGSGNRFRQVTKKFLKL